MRDDLGLDISLAELAAHHIEINLAGEKMKQTPDGLLKILSLEEERYIEMLRKGQNVIQTQLAKLSKEALEIPDDILFNLNDSHGLTPDMSVSLANISGWKNVILRTGFSAEMAQRHAIIAKAAAKQVTNNPIVESIPQLPKTVPLYYEDVQQREFDASVLACLPLIGEDIPANATHGIVLEKTCFYPEGGGQEGDYGMLSTDSCNRTVLDTRKVGDLVVHLTDGAFEAGDLVHGSLDWNRRKQLMDHHTAVHIVGGAARRILGPHIYQAGANKSVESGRLDITHFRRLNRDDLDAIEGLANEVIGKVQRTEKTTLNRKDADRKYGFDLYQGGAPKGSDIRILRISDHDIQACGGTHHDEPGQIGSIRIIRSAAVQDGVERLHIVAGQAALDFAREQGEILRMTSEIFAVSNQDLPKTAQRFFGEWKEQRKRIEQLEAEIVRLRTSGGGDATAEVDGVRIVIMEADGDLKQMTKMLRELTLDSTTPTLAVLGSRVGGGKLMVAVTDDTIAREKYNAVEILKQIAGHINGGGGGRPTMAQGGGSNPDGLDDALQAARDFVSQ